MEVAERRGLPLALAQALAHPLHDALQAASVVEPLHVVDVLPGLRGLHAVGAALGVLAAQLLDRAAVRRDDEEAAAVVDLLTAQELLVEPVPRLVVERVEVGVVEADALRREP